MNKNIRMAIKAEVKRMTLHREVGDVMDLMEPITEDQEANANMNLADNAYS